MDVRRVEKHPQNMLVTLVITNMLTPQGPLAFEVSETPEEVIQKIETALCTSPISLN